MPNTREKLIELVDEAEEHATDICVFYDSCEDCPGRKYGNKCRDYLKADHLIAHGVTVQEWISVKDRLPIEEDAINGGFVLAYTAENKVIIALWSDVCRFSEFVTHWMPLPEPPKGE